jgi:hypothetical protein
MALLHRCGVLEVCFSVGQQLPAAKGLKAALSLVLCEVCKVCIIVVDLKPRPVYFCVGLKTEQMCLACLKSTALSQTCHLCATAGAITGCLGPFDAAVATGQSNYSFCNTVVVLRA